MPSPSKSWTVVLFTKEGTVEAVPSRWINGDNCLWPTVPRDKLNTLLKNCEFNSCWPSVPVRIFRNATYDNFCTARAKATKAEETSELNTDEEVQDEWRISKRKQKKRIYTSSESSEDEEKKTITNKKRKLPPAPTWMDNLSLTIDDNNENLALPRATSSRAASPPSDIMDALSCKSVENVIDKNNTINNCKCNPHLMHNMHTMLLDLNKKVDNILNRQPASGTSSEMTSVNILEKSEIKFPINNMDQLNKFEEFLNANPEHFSALIVYFASQGGGNIYEFVRRCIAPVADDELCKLFSFTGKKGKKEFAKLKLAQAVIESAQKIGLAGNRKEIEIKIGDWLRRASARIKSRSELKNSL